MDSKLYPVVETLRRIGARERRERERVSSEKPRARGGFARRSASAERRWFAALVVGGKDPKA
jgi:hypothetical protein